MSLTEALDRSLKIIEGKVDPDQPPLFNPLTQNIADVFLMWDESLAVREHTRESYRNHVVRFLNWCEKEGIELLGQLQRTHLLAYARHLIDELDLSRDSQRLGLFPIKSMLKWARSNWPEHIRDIAEGVRPKASRSHRLARRPPTLLEAIELLESLHAQNRWEVLPGMALQLLCGLRLQEAFALEWGRVDLESGLIEISGAIKNADSARVIPIPEYALRILQRAPRLGKTLGAHFRRWEEYSKRVKFFLDRAGHNSAVGMTLRKTLETSALAEGWGSLEILNRYCGRASNTVQAKHYLCLTTPQWVEVFRTQIIEPLNRRIQEITSGYESH